MMAKGNTLDDIATAARSAGSVPDYRGIIEGVRLIRRLASSTQSSANFCWAIALIAPLCAVAATIFIDVSITTKVNYIVVGIVVMLIAATAATSLGRRAIMLRLQAELALAQRDVAINSFAWRA